MKMNSEFIPKSFLYLKNYTRQLFYKDLVAGITVGIIALPLAMAFSIASGVPPERGLFTAIVAGFLISALGGSSVQIGGPTGAFVVLVYDIMSRTGYEGLALSTIIAAFLLIAIGLFKAGSWIKYIPYPLIIGFTTGIAVIIFSAQIKDFMGLSLEAVPANFVKKWISYVEAFPSIRWPTFALASGTLGFIIAIRRFFPRIPWGIAALAVSTAAALFFNLPVETIESRFGNLPHSLSLPSFPSLSLLSTNLHEILFDALAIALLGGIESLLSAVIADGMIGSRHKSNCELVGLGIANFASILFGGIPATGAIARTTANVKSGAQTPMAGMIHAATLFLIIFLFAQIAGKIPLASLSAILMIIAWNMSELHHFFHLFRAPAADRSVLLTAFLLTIFVDITFAIAFGMVLACFLFMKKMSQYSKMVSLTSLFQENGPEFFERTDPDAVCKKRVPPGVEIFEVNGPFFFGAADILQDLENQESPTKIFILRMRHVPLIDASGIHALIEFLQRCQKKRIELFLSGVHGQAEKDLYAFGFVRLIGKNAIFPHIDAALACAEERLKSL
jgi:SulP family sulfate permease